MQQIQLSIPEPCHQNWDAMTATQQGRFCNACAKQVIDFSTMSDAQVLNYFSGLTNDKVCGRVYPDQLDRTMAMPVPGKKKLFRYWHYVTMLFLFFGKTNNTKAQGGMRVITKTKLDSIKPASLQHTLDGKLNAVETQQPVIRLGKINSNKNKQPVLYIIDNNIVSDKTAGKLNPNDIESIEVLQGAKAGAIYGAVASEGAIIITTANKTSSAKNKTGKEKYSVRLKITDNATMQPVDKATLTIARIGDAQPGIILTDEKGIGTIDNIKEEETYLIKITGDGYLNQELQISASDLNERKINKEIFLEQAPVQSDYKKMDSVVIQSYPVQGRLLRCTAGGLSVTRTIKKTFKDSISVITSSISGAIKIAPNPVQKGNSFKVELKVQQTGLYTLQLIDAGGQVIFQKQVSVAVKQYTEQVQSELKWSSGIYFMRVLNDKNGLISTGKLVIQ
jgi:TonB-dependent SusC/RagA subfamily outer membrane receptor